MKDGEGKEGRPARARVPSTTHTARPQLESQTIESLGRSHWLIHTSTWSGTRNGVLSLEAVEADDRCVPSDLFRRAHQADSLTSRSSTTLAKIRQQYTADSSPIQVDLVGGWLIQRPRRRQVGEEGAEEGGS